MESVLGENTNYMELSNYTFGMGNNNIITVFIESKRPSIVKYIPISGMLKCEKCVVNLMKYSIKMVGYLS